MNKKTRPAAVPLVTVDPFFSIWSCADNLNDECTRNWAEFPNPILSGIMVDGCFHSMSAVDSNFVQYRRKMLQTDLRVMPLKTVYKFENEFAVVTLCFTTPLLLDRLDIMSRPVSYIEYEIEKKDKSRHIEFVFGINARCCVRNNNQEVVFEKTDFSLRCGNTVQNPLAQSGDMDVIDWGYLHLCDKSAFVSTVNMFSNQAIEYKELNRKYNAFVEMPYLTVKKSELSGLITLAYDEIKAIEYFGTQLDECYTEYFESFGDMVRAAIAEYPEIKVRCDEFDKELLDEAEKYGENYKDIISLSYRQAIAAHKLVKDENGDYILLSKECESNGCIGTLDVTYPSIPLFLKYNPKLVSAMLRPIIKYAKSNEWEYDFTPHDVGQYPLANGQVYGMQADKQKQHDSQMPIEESGNAILCLAAEAYFSKNTPELFKENKELIKKWADYLVEFGYDPANQLCTDDFAGHLNHNCNLSLKAILGIAAYGILSGESSYTEKAKEYAAKWEQETKANHGATRLTFDNPDGWSLKYNMVWDNILGINIFSDDVKKNEINHYMKKLNRYGVPLDSRSDYTKLDWLMWSTRIWEDEEYFEKVSESIVNMINETKDRVPLTDWYYTSTAQHIMFQNRTVVGGLFINLL